MRLETRTGIRIDAAEARMFDFLAEEWRYYDGVEDVEPNAITVIDVLAPAMVNACMGTGAGWPVSPMRLLEFLVWSETEPHAYYRRPHV